MPSRRAISDFGTFKSSYCARTARSVGVSCVCIAATPFECRDRKYNSTFGDPSEVFYNTNSPPLAVAFDFRTCRLIRPLHPRGTKPRGGSPELRKIKLAL